MSDSSKEIGLVRPSSRSALKIVTDTASQGYGTDPNMITATVPWKGVLSSAELSSIVALSDVILPGTDNAPSPSYLNIGGFFNEWLSAPYPTQLGDRQLILSGINLLDAQCRQQFCVVFTGLEQVERIEMVSWLSKSQGVTREFFSRFRYLLIGGYFTSNFGMIAIGYRGNVPLTAFPPVTAEAQQIIQEELAKLGLL